MINLIIFREKRRRRSSYTSFAIKPQLNFNNSTTKYLIVYINIMPSPELQGMSKDILIVNDWNYRCVNWIYVVLSRVRTLAGLYLMKPLDLERSFNVPQNLIRFEQRLKDTKERPILDMLGYQSNAEIDTMQ